MSIISYYYLTTCPGCTLPSRLIAGIGSNSKCVLIERCNVHVFYCKRSTLQCAAEAQIGRLAAKIQQLFSVLLFLTENSVFKMMWITKEAVMFFGKLIVKFFLTKQFCSFCFFSVRFNHFLLPDLFSLYCCFLWAWLDMTNLKKILNWQLNHYRNYLWHFNVYCSRGSIFVWPNAKWSDLICICWHRNES